MAKNDNLKDFLTDVADAIRAKKGTTDKINPQDFSAEIASIETSSGGSTSSGWTGHADAEGLRAIGWTDEDIAYYQAHGVNWNAEDDEYHKVTDDNKALYGVLTANNISTYKDRIVYLPKIDISQASVANIFNDCRCLVAIPQIDTSNRTSMSSMFKNCYSLVSIPLLDTSKVTNMYETFFNCRSLVSIPILDTSKVENMGYTFYNCYSLVSIPLLDTSKVKSVQYMFSECAALVSIPQIDTSQVIGSNYMNNAYIKCYSLNNFKIKSVKFALSLSDSVHLSKESLLYIINNEAATSAITITLNSYAYTRLANDADIVAALANHPNISLAK